MKTDHVNLISFHKNISIFKINFRLAKTNFSRKTSGNRCIISLNRNNNEIKILLMYHKNDIDGKNETAAWKKIIRDNYDDYDFLK